MVCKYKVVDLYIWFYPLKLRFFIPEFHAKMTIYTVTITCNYILEVKTIRQVPV